MIKVSRTALAVALVAGLAACGGAEENNANQTAATNQTQAASPYSEAGQRMSQAMMSAVGSDVGDNWARKMIVHHEGAIEMAQIGLQQNLTPDAAEMARMTVEKQRKEIDDIRKLLKQGSPDQRSAELYRPAMMDMHQKMQAATGADASETFMRKMLEHHRGSVAMSDVALQNGVSGALREQVQRTRDDQQKDAQMIEAMLRGETMQHAMEQSGAKGAEEAKAEPAPAEQAKAAPKAEPKTAPEPAKTEPKPAPAAQPKAEPKAPAATCLPEHRAAGHC